MTRSFLVALVAGLVLSPVTSVSAGAASPDEVPPGVGIRLVDAPVATADDPRAQVYVIDHVAPGSLIERRVEISNGTRESQQVQVYPAAASIDEGTFRGVEGRAQNELSGWVSVRPDGHELGPGAKAMVQVSIRVPDDASPGERYGVVWAEMRNPATDGGVTQVARVGVRVYLSVGPGGLPPSDFKIASLTPDRTENGRPFIRATVKNTGQRALDFTGELRLTDGPGGLSAGPFKADPGTTLAIGESAPVTVVLDKALPEGPWRAQLKLRSGLETRSAQATITFPSVPGAGAAVPVDSGGPGWWLVALAVVLTLLVLMALLLLRRRRG